jgi:hypothetical protein
LFAACASDFGEACDFPEADEIEDSCYPVTGEDTSFCVYTQSETCDSRQCGAYLGSDSFCTEECTEDAQCSGSAFCQTISGSSITGFCVPESFRQ